MSFEHVNYVSFDHVIRKEHTRNHSFDSCKMYGFFYCIYLCSSIYAYILADMFRSPARSKRHPIFLEFYAKHIVA